MSELRSSKVPDFKPTIPADLIPDLANKDKFLFERIDVITQSLNWQNEKIFNLQHTVDDYANDIEDLKKFKSVIEQSSSLDKAVSTVKKETKNKFKKLALPAVGIFLGILYPVYLEGFRELGSETIIKNLLGIFK